MKALVQRVKYARVTINGEETRETGPGLLVLFGCAEDDSLESCAKLAQKTAMLRIFDDEEGKLNLSALDLGLSVMVVSQFTLLADTKKGNRPSFTAAGAPDFSNTMYLRFIEECRALGFQTEHGEFGAHMRVSLINDGPVTIMLDSKQR